MNVAAGKTEAFIWWAGEESMKHRRGMTSDDGSCAIPLFVDQTLRLALHYKHVVLHNTPTGSLGEEVASKSSAASTATKALMRPVLTQKEYPNFRALGIGRVLCLFQTGCGFIGLGRAEPVLNSSDGDPARTPMTSFAQGIESPALRQQ